MVDQTRERELRACIKKGVALLDGIQGKKSRDPWWWFVNLDVLSMSSGPFCVLGQLRGGEYTPVSFGLTLETAGAYGFAACTAGEYEYLTAEWKAVIQFRLLRSPRPAVQPAVEPVVAGEPADVELAPIDDPDEAQVPSVADIAALLGVRREGARALSPPRFVLDFSDQLKVSPLRGVASSSRLTSKASTHREAGKNIAIGR